MDVGGVRGCEASKLEVHVNVPNVVLAGIKGRRDIALPSNIYLCTTWGVTWGHAWRSLHNDAGANNPMFLCTID